MASENKQKVFPQYMKEIPSIVIHSYTQLRKRGQTDNKKQMMEYSA